MLNKLIIFLIRMKLHLRKGEKFQFDNQKTDSVYWFMESALMKMEKGLRYESDVSLNWLLNSDCKVRAPYNRIVFQPWNHVEQEVADES